MRSRFAIAFAVVLLLGGPKGRAADVAQVTVKESDGDYTLANEYVTARVNKRNANLVSLKYRGFELLGAGSGHPYAYWSHPTAGFGVENSVTIDPGTNGGTRAEVSCRFPFMRANAGGQRRRGGGGGAGLDIEIRYALGRSDSGIFTYSIFTHPADYPATQIGEARFGAKLNPEVFDYMTVDANRRKLMPTPEDWDRGTEMNMKEARRLNTGIYKGQVEHKYDYSAIQFDIPAFGWSSTGKRIGLWFINPSMEYLSGGATKVELTCHLDNNEGAAPTILNYWRGSHYGGSSCVITQGETWSKVVGPFMIYCNAGDDHDAMWKDALAMAEHEAKAWPYEWVRGVDYPHAAERGTVSGRLELKDPNAGMPGFHHLLVGLSAPDYEVGGWFGSSTVDWQLDAKHYEFWVRGDDTGGFSIPNVRPGTYTLHAIADGVLGEFNKSNIVVEAGGKMDLGGLKWMPQRHGRMVWEIGVANRSAEEFRHGDHYWQWGLYNDYTKEFPRDVNFIIGKSDWRTDWNYAQLGRGDGRSNVWSVRFTMPEPPKGRATLSLGLAATSVRNIRLNMNEQSIGEITRLPDTATIRRDGIRGYWEQREVEFDAGLLKAGTNVLTLTIPSGGVTSGVEYDYLRLEVDPDGS